MKRYCYLEPLSIETNAGEQKRPVVRHWGLEENRGIKGF